VGILLFNLSGQNSRIVDLFGLLLLYFSAADALAACSDQDAKAAADVYAQSYFKTSQIFYPAKVLKKHSPSGEKEVASYLEANGKKYSIYTLITAECSARFIKRTRP
jgi:hypothetical protein